MSLFYAEQVLICIWTVVPPSFVFFPSLLYSVLYNIIGLRPLDMLGQRGIIASQGRAAAVFAGMR